MLNQFSSLLELLRWRASHQAEQHAYTFLIDGEIQEAHLTYSALEQQARAIATQLQALDALGERALLLYPPGLDFIAGFFGCLYAGVIAVPAYPPRRKQSLSRLQAIVADAQPTLVLTTTSLCADIASRQDLHSNLATLSWIATDSLRSELSSHWQQPAVDHHTIAFLQYTSGSTGTPRGVMVSHGNLLHNAALIQQSFEHRPDSRGVIWLPPYHDMGLIGGILQPLYVGFPATLMSPVAFLQKPFRWLQAVSSYKATTSGGPNFAYDLCVDRITPEQWESLDLSSWEVAFNGSEPVRVETLERFAAKFEPCGFHREAFYPCYGLAEATLFVAGGLKNASPMLCSVDRTALEQNSVANADDEQESVKTIVSCGRAWFDQQLVIVDPESLTPCPAKQVGEIWVSGSSVAQGYWNRSELTEKIFHAYVADTGEGPFLRTGDLGFIKDGELFVTGRLKDVIVIRGRNHYPEDIERTAEQSHPALRPGFGAAFTVEVGDEERLVIVQEVERSYLKKLDEDEVIGTIRQVVSQEHELQVHTVVLLKTASIPKTSSGKIQRRLCRTRFLEGNLDVLACNTLDDTHTDVEDPGEAEEAAPDTVQTRHHALLELDLRDQLAGILDIPPSRLDTQQALNTLGLDSLQVIELKHRVEANFEIQVTVEQFFEGLTLRRLAQQILNHVPSPVASSRTHQVVAPDAPPNPSRAVERYDSLVQAKVTADNNGMQFSLLYFSSNAAAYEDNKYRLLIEGAKFADQNGFSAVWIPERHFHAFGGIYPNPSVLASALAMVTQRIRIRAGSVVLPLHDPIRVAEEWAVVDNLSQGRVDLAFATGWNPNDFVLSPESYAKRIDALFSGMATVQKLWRGEAVSRPNGVGEEIQVSIYPLPEQRELPVWITCSGGEERFAEAGAAGANVLTALLFQSIEELAQKIALYRASRARHGFDPDTGHVTLMLHTFIGEDLEEVREKVKKPFTNYLKSSVSLWRQASKSLSELSEREQDEILAYAFERYFQTAALFGTPDTGLSMVARLRAIGVDEIACLIDFGVDADSVMAALPSLVKLKERAQAPGGEQEELREGHGIVVKIDGEYAEQLLAKLDQLSDEEVDSLLGELSGKEEVTK